MRKLLLIAASIIGFASVPDVQADVEEYAIDTRGAHAFVQFRIKHLGFSWLYGRFDEFSGNFAFDPENPANANVAVTIKTDSLDSNHAERDKHLKSADFLDVAKFPEATFKSTRVVVTGGDAATIFGNLTLHGVTKEVEIAAKLVGRGDDPWGGYRAGFEGTTTLKLADFGITTNLGPASTHVELSLNVEGVRQ